MVPEGWKQVLLKDILDGPVKNGYSPVAADTFTGYWVLSLGALGDDSLNINEVKPVIPEEKVKKALLRDGDFLVSRSNTPEKVGRSARFRGEIENCSYPDLMMRFRIDEGKANPSYVEQKLKSSPIRAYFKNCAAGSSSTMVKINKSILEKTQLFLPEIEEQRNIADILAVWDKAITTAEQLLVNSRRQKKALMQQLLTGKKRLLDQNGERFSGEWKRVELGDLLGYKQPTPYLVESAEYNDDNKTPVLTAGKTFILGYTNEDFGIFSEDLPVIIFDDFTTDSKFVDFSFKVKSSAMKILAAKDGVSIKYVFEAMQLIDFAVGGHQRHWISIYSRLAIPLPSKEEQQKIATVLSTADQEIIALQYKINALKQEKKALMQQLLTGKRRVNIS